MTFSAFHSQRQRFVSLLVLAAVPVLAATIGAEPLNQIPNPRTRDGSWVTDMPGALRHDTIARLNSTLADVERTSGVEAAVVVITSLDGLSVEEAAENCSRSGASARKTKIMVCCSCGRPATGAFASKLDMGSKARRRTARLARFSTPMSFRSSKQVTSTKASSTVSMRSWLWRVMSRSNWRL